jgi:hypothetical protein
MKHNSRIQIKMNVQFNTKFKDISDAFVNCFKSVFNTPCPSVISPYSVTTDFFTCGASLCRHSHQCYKASETKCVGLDHHRHHWLESPVWALAFFKSFLHSALFNAKFFQFLFPKSLISWSTLSPHLWVGMGIQFSNPLIVCL